MLNFTRKHKGAISVFLTLILIPTFIFGGVIIDGSRILGAKNIVSGAGDLAMNGALSNYYEELNQVYGLLAMADTAQEVQDIIQEFFEVSMNASGVDPEDFGKALVYLELTNDGFLAADIPGTEIYQTEVIKKEMLEYMKYRAPVTLVNRAITDKLGDLENMEKEKKAADGELKFESSLNDMQEIFDELEKLTDRQKEIYGEVMTEEEYTQLLSKTKSDYDKISVMAVTKKRLDTCLDTKDGDALGLMDEMTGLSCNTGNLDAQNCSVLIKMKIIANSMASKDPESILEGLDPDSDEYKEREELIAEYESALENLADGEEKLNKELKSLVEDDYAVMNEQRKLAEEGEENCIEIQEKTGELRAEFEKLHEKYDNWKNAVGDLPEGESKTAYEKNIDEVDDFFEAEGSLGDFEELIKNNETFYGEVCERLDEVTLDGKRIDWDIKKVSDVTGIVDPGALKEESEIRVKAQEFMGKYSTPNLMDLSVTNNDVSSDEFVKKLKDYYCKRNVGNEDKANKATQKWDGEMTKMTQKLEELLLCSDLPDVNVMEAGKSDLPTNWLSVSAGSASGEITIGGGLGNKDSRKNAADKGSDNLNTDNGTTSGMTSLSSKIGKGVEELIEPLILTEYVVGMFSHNTSDKDKDGNKIDDPLSVSNAHFNLVTNSAYRAEVEYILWGDPNIKNNVQATKAIIFTTNLVFNMSFAFTNSNIRNDALMIAGFFPVGPLGKTAIKCALQSMVAMIETTKNMLELMEGKRVPLIKTSATWNTWILSGGGNEVKYDAGFTYEDYLWILVCVNMYTSRQTDMLGRAADIMELNLTENKAKEDYTLKDKFTMLEIETTVGIDTFFMQRLNGAGYGVQAVGKEDFTIPYHGIQGY